MLVLVYFHIGSTSTCIFFNIFDQKIIDGTAVVGTAKVVGRIASVVRNVQSGYLYHYLAMMIFGLMVILVWFLLV